jgi:hypothetical protein
MSASDLERLGRDAALYAAIVHSLDGVPYHEENENNKRDEGVAHVF